MSTPETLNVQLRGEFQEHVRKLWERVKGKRHFRRMRSVHQFVAYLIDEGLEQVERDHGDG